MSQSWKSARLGELCEFRSGLWKGKKPPFVTAGVLRNTNFHTDGRLDYTDVATLEVEERQLAKRLLRYGDIILEKSGGGPKQPVGRVALFDATDGVFSFSNFTSALRVRDPSKLDCRFLHQFLRFFHLSGATVAIQSHSTGIRNLSLAAYKEIDIPLPSLAEQKRIVAILDRAFEASDVARTNADKNVLNARELPKSVLSETFDRVSARWIKKRLGDIFTFRNGRAFKKQEWSKTGLPIIRIQNLNDRAAAFNYYNGSYARDIFIEQGDLLFSWSGTVGTSFGSHVWSGDSGLLNQHIFKVTHGNDIDRQYANYALRNITAEIEKDVGGAVGLTHITKAKLLEFTIPVPPLAEQKHIVANLDASIEETRQLTCLCERRLAALEALKQSLLHNAFSGSL